MEDKTKKCVICGAEAIIYIPYEGKAYCERHFVDRFKKRVRKTLSKEKMLKPREKIGFAISDTSSLVAMDVLIPIIRKWKVEALAISIDVGLGEYGERRISLVKMHTEKLGIPHVVVKFQDHNKTPVEKMNTSRCEYCEKNRNELLLKTAQELGLDKIVTGNNLDDFAEIAFLKLLEGKWGNASTFVSPLKEIPESEIMLFAKIHGIEQIQDCPYMDEFRRELRKELANLEKRFPEIKFSITRMEKRIEELLKT